MRSNKFLCALYLLISFVLFYGCSTGEYALDPKQIDMGGGKPQPYRIQSRDVIKVEFPLTPKHTQEVTVRPDGSIVIEVAGEIKAAGMTPLELAEHVKKRASWRLRNPEVAVTIVESSQKVYIGGEVRSPGIVSYYKGLTALQAIFERGGFLNTAESDNILLIRAENEQMNITRLKMEDVASHLMSANDVIYIPKTGVAKAGLAVRQFIRDMLPVTPGYSLP